MEPLAACQEQHCCHGQADRNPVRLSERDWTKQISEQVADGNGEPDIWHTLCVATGRGNFSRVGTLIGMELESNPELAREPDSALRIALGYWIANKISTVGAATGDPVKAVTKRINSKLVWLSDRQAYLAYKGSAILSIRHGYFRCLKWRASSFANVDLPAPTGRSTPEGPNF